MVRATTLKAALNQHPIIGHPYCTKETPPITPTSPAILHAPATETALDLFLKVSDFFFSCGRYDLGVYGQFMDYPPRPRPPSLFYLLPPNPPSPLHVPQNLNTFNPPPPLSLSLKTQCAIPVTVHPPSLAFPPHTYSSLVNNNTPPPPSPSGPGPGHEFKPIAGDISVAAHPRRNDSLPPRGGAVEEGLQSQRGLPQAIDGCTTNSWRTGGLLA